MRFSKTLAADEHRPCNSLRRVVGRAPQCPIRTSRSESFSYVLTRGGALPSSDLRHSKASQRKTRMINLGIIGMGHIGRIHLEVARRVPNLRVWAVATSRPEAVRRSNPDLMLYPSYTELLGDRQLDAVVICLPTYLHEPCAIEAAERGFHVLCEKPMALDAAAALRMVKAADHNGRILMMAQVLRFWPHYVRIKELIASHAVGSVRWASAYRLAQYPPWADWFRDPAKSGGCLLDLQIHDVDFLHWILGHPHQVYTIGVRSTTKSWDHVFTTLSYPDVQATAEATYLMPNSWPFTTGIRVVGTKGAIEYFFRMGGNVEEREKATQNLRLYGQDGKVSEPAVSNEDPYVAQLRHFAHCVSQREVSPICPPEESYRVMTVMAGCRKSVENRRVVELQRREAGAAR
jgi:UDP-N-acetylglucosamine 3-dehydrogenase